VPDTGLTPDEDLLARLATHGDLLTGAAMAPLITDVYRQRETPLAVVRPASVAALQGLVREASAAGVAIVARGGGASYTDAYLPDRARAILIDTGALTAIHIDTPNCLVTVEAGVTWAALREALAEQGLRTPFWGPFSGLHATVAGSVSQNSISHGSGAFGISAQSVLSVDVVLASGEMLSTGTAAYGARPHLRWAGPDLTGLFCGDAGALGVKARITLPLLRAKADFQTASFAYASLEALHAGMRAAALEGLDDEHFALDAALSQGQIAKQESSGALFSMAAAVLRTAPSLPIGLAQLLKMATAGTKALANAAYACHFILEGATPIEAKAKLHRLRALMEPFGAEIPNSVPSVVRGMPFAPFYNVLGPKGERWVPLHGVLSHDQVGPFHAALQALYASRKAEMERHGVWTGAMFETVGSSGFLYEVAFNWPGARNAYHEAVVPQDYLAAVPTYPADPGADAFLDQLKQDVTALYSAHGAGHFQLGKTYPHATRLSAPALAALKAMKAQLDPDGLMNPGALGL
jgi:FAD/FMN-containing dehydrogenase